MLINGYLATERNSQIIIIAQSKLAVQIFYALQRQKDEEHLSMCAWSKCACFYTILEVVVNVSNMTSSKQQAAGEHVHT